MVVLKSGVNLLKVTQYGAKHKDQNAEFLIAVGMIGATQHPELFQC